MGRSLCLRVRLGGGMEGVNSKTIYMDQLIRTRSQACLHRFIHIYMYVYVSLNMYIYVSTHTPELEAGGVEAVQEDDGGRRHAHSLWICGPHACWLSLWVEMQAG